jgi:hypothetical protein
MDIAWGGRMLALTGVPITTDRANIRGVIVIIVMISVKAMPEVTVTDD